MEKNIENYMPGCVELYDVDRNDNLQKHSDLLQQCIQENTLSPIAEKAPDFWDFPEQLYLDEIRDVMEADGLLAEYEKNEDKFIEWLHDHDTSSPAEKLLKNTGNTVFFYFLDLVDGHSCDPELKEKILRKIKKVLKPKNSNDTDSELQYMIDEASDGGELRIYFTATVSDLIDEAKDFQTISFKGKCCVAIVDSSDGTGADCTVELNLDLPFSRENLFIDKCVRYSYTYDICDMPDDWCKRTSFQLSHSPLKKKTAFPVSKNGAYLKQQAEYAKTFKNGGCTLNDMNITRHQNVEYINEFPCGFKCLSCGTSWNN
ncbi:MAG: hypothetical protein LBM08_00775 [Dysgonamonadaceae bacterium]|nr:hypothetical protein [Dysgonamonadaceae bacterium]